MKRNLFFSLILIGCCACSNDARLLSGDYSYKTSGSVVISTDTEEITYQLPDKIGQLNVVDLKATDKDSVLLVLHLGVAGVALPTLISRAVAAFLILRAAEHGAGPVQLHLRGLRLRGHMVRRILEIGVPSAVEHGLFQLGRLLVVHCASSTDGVAISHRTGFETAARPVWYGDE